MAEECEFYYWDSWNRDYSCSLKKSKGLDESVDSDWVHKYCWNYGYDKCPYYIKEHGGSSGSSGCYLTSACIHAKNLPDDCEELTVMRNFRDTYVKSTDGGEAVIRHYYDIAPKIVNSINTQSPCPCEVWHRIYEELVQKCIALIKKGAFQEAFELYKSYTLKLEKEYC